MSRISKPASRVLALLMVVCMIIGMLPVSAFAAEGETMPITTVVEDGHDHDHDHEAIDDEQENIEDEEPVIEDEESAIEDEETVIDEEKLVIELESIDDQQEAVEAEVTPRAGEQIVEITTNKDKNSATEDISIAVGESFILELKNGSGSSKRHAISNTDSSVASVDAKIADGEEIAATGNHSLKAEVIEATGEHTYENGACTECGEEEPYLVSISVTTNPTVMVYVEGDSFNPAGMVVTATYSNGKTKEVTGYSITGGMSMALGTNYITISYKEGDVTAVATLAVSVVNAQTVLSIAVTTNPIKMIYTEGESFDPTGMVVTATYADGSRPISGYTTVNDTNMPIGQQTITISYEEGGATVTTTLVVTVKAALTGITVNTENAKMEYADGEAFDPTGLVVTAAYADGTKAEVTDYTVEGSEDMQVGENTIIIRYQERGVTKTQELVVTVYAVLTDISVNTEAVKLAYNYGETFDPTGLIVTAVYSDETTKVLGTEDYTITGGTDMKVGDNTITVSYTEGGVTVTKEFVVTVTAVLTGIEVNTDAVMLAYNYGEAFDPTGMVVTAVYSDGTTKVLEADEYTIIGGIDMKTGENTITISYTEGDVTATEEFVVTVTAVLTGIEVNTDAVKLEYTEGEKFDPTGLVVTATYSDGTTKALAVGDYTVEGGENMVVGENTITITYTDGEVAKTATIKVTVKKAPIVSTVMRVAGTSRVDTALEVADALKEALGVDKFETVIIANGEDKNFADALTGSYLATVKNAPILLYRTSGLADTTRNYIKNNLISGGTIYLLGGELAIPASVAEELTAAGYTVKRLAGGSRFDTNLAILEEAGVGNKEILIARGFEFADSLSASATGLPILMVNEVTGKLTDAQIEFLQNHENNQMTILGGTIAVSEALEATIEEVVGKNVGRVFGTSREATSVEIAKRYFDAPEFAVAAYSRKCPDGLCGGPLAYAMGAPLLLVNAGQESYSRAYTTENEITAGYVLGGTLVITDATARAVFGLAEDAVIEVK